MQNIIITEPENLSLAINEGKKLAVFVINNTNGRFGNALMLIFYSHGNIFSLFCLLEKVFYF